MAIRTASISYQVQVNGVDRVRLLVLSPMNKEWSHQLSMRSNIAEVWGTDM